jgi:hypothetical protein
MPVSRQSPKVVIAHGKKARWSAESLSVMLLMLQEPTYILKTPPVSALARLPVKTMSISKEPRTVEPI